MKFCINCGNQLDDNQRFCPSCGTNQNPQQTPPAPQYQPRPTRPLAFSDWDGGVFDTVVNSIVASLIISFTCGIATPWAICYMYKFIIGHTLVEGKRLRFDGTGSQLFGNWIKWFLLTVITCGIYSFWVIPRLYKWIASHTHFE